MELNRTFDLLALYKQKWPEKEDALASRQKGVWRKYSIEEYANTASYFSYALLATGFQKGDKIATITNNRPEWNITDMGASQAGVIHVPIYPTISDEEFNYILSHSGVRMLIVSDLGIYKKLKSICEKLPSIENIYTFNETDQAPGFGELIKLGREKETDFKERLEKVKESILPDDTLSITYTSGTTGKPKGVMLTHRNFLENIWGCSQCFTLEPHYRVLSFLPLCHVFERMVNYFYHYAGVSIYYAENMGTIADNLKELKIDLFVTVPRLMERVYDKIISKGKGLKGLKKQLFFWAVNLGLKYEVNTTNRWYLFRLKLARRLIFRKWQEALGGNLKFIIAGGASLQVRLARIFWAAGIPVLEGYGLTETSPVVSVNFFERPGNVKFGTVGPVLPNVEAKIAEDGEILVRGDNVMKGYYKDPEQTAAVIDEKGWFHTGDIGVFEEGKFLKITDRKKEMFKTSSGRYIAPQLIENKLKESLFIEQAMVVGENEKFVSALISPHFEFLHNWCFLHNIHYRDNEELLKIPEVTERYQREINEINKSLGQTEQIKRFRLVHEEWAPETGELSPTLKLRRHVIYEKHKEILDKIYGYKEK